MAGRDRERGTDTDPIDVREPGAHSIAVVESGFFFLPDSVGSTDVNGDGLSDAVAVSAGDRPVVVLYGDSEPADVALTDLAQGDPRGFVLDYVPAPTAVGDVNADGFGDLLLSRTIMFGGPYEATVSDLYAQGRAFDVIPPNGGWPEIADAAGDFNGDGFGDVVFGRIGDDPTGVWIVFGKDDAAKVELDDLEEGIVVGTAIEVPEGYAGFGTELAGVGDVNGDGRGDVLVSALHVDSGPDRARAWVIYGDDGKTSIDVGELGDNRRGIVFEYPASNVDRFQPWVDGGDFNHDGVPDLVLGADGLRDWSVKVVFGVPTQDTCCIARDDWGCTNPEVAACVCESLPTCCEDAWGEECVAAVAEGCGLCSA